MDYGDDWPPPPEKPEPAAPKRRRRRLSLWQACLIAIGAYAVVAVAGLIALHYHQQTIRFGTPAPTSHSANTR
jgi:hypothetical protein